MRFTLGISPCPNDTFIFDALVHHKIDTRGIDFDLVMDDIQALNSMAAEGKLDITKLSLPAFIKCSEEYKILNSGGALGKGVGPLLIAKKMVNVPDIEHCTIALPGENTTANFLLGYAFPNAKHKIPMLFSEIEDAVLMGKTDLGVIIHENRFTYHQKGLIKVCDLGEIWEEKEKLPIPLACIAAKKTIPDDIRQIISDLIKQSVELAFSHYPSISEFTKLHAQEMNEDVMRRHIDLYVNNYSVDLGAGGHKAIERFREVYHTIH